MVYNKEKGEPCMLQPLHNEDGSLWGYAVTDNNGRPFQCHSNNNEKRRSDTIHDDSMALPTASKPYTYLTDREIVAEDPSALLLQFKNYRELILQWITERKDMLALRSTCRALRSICDMDLNVHWRRFPHRCNPPFKYFRALVSRQTDWNFCHFNFSNVNCGRKIVSLHLDVMELNDSYWFNKNIKQGALFNLTYEYESKKMKLTICKNTQLKELVIGRFSFLNNGHDITTITTEETDNEPCRLKEFTLKELQPNVTFRFQPLHSRTCKVMIEKVLKGAKIELDQIWSSDITICEMEEGSMIDLSSEHPADKYLDMLGGLTIGKVANGVKVGPKFRNIFPHAITYKKSEIHDENFLKQVEHIKKLTHFGWSSFYLYVSANIKEVWNGYKKDLDFAKIVALPFIIFTVMLSILVLSLVWALSGVAGRMACLKPFMQKHGPQD